MEMGKYNITVGNITSEGDLDVSKTANLNDVNIDGNITLNKNSGNTGQYLRKGSDDNQEWANISASDINPGTSGQILVTTNDGNNTEWSKNIDVNTININNSIIIRSDAGSTGQYIRNVLGLPEWGNIKLTDMEPGIGLSVLGTNVHGTTVNWIRSVNLLEGIFSTLTSTNTNLNTNTNLTGKLFLNSNEGETGDYIRKSGTSQYWSKIVASDITPGPLSSVLITNPLGASTWSNNINVGTVTTSAITFPNGTLNTYQQYLTTVRFRYNTSWLTNVQYKVVRIGAQITFMFDNFSGNYSGSGVFYLSSNLQENFRPSLPVQTVHPITVGSNIQLGLVEVDTDGKVTVYASISKENFPTTETSFQISAVTMCWIRNWN